MDMAPVSDWESRGRCEKKNQKTMDNVKTEASEEDLPKYEKKKSPSKVKPVSEAIVFPKDEQSDSEEDKRFSVKNLSY